MRQLTVPYKDEPQMSLKQLQFALFLECSFECFDHKLPIAIYFIFIF